MYYVKKYEHKLLSETLRFLGFTVKWGIHENGYWLTNLNYSFDYMLSNLVIKYLKEKKVKSVIDVGCGYGHYVNELNFHKIRAVGVDGNFKLVNLLKNEDIFPLDATNEYFVAEILNRVNDSNRKEHAKEDRCLDVNRAIKKAAEIGRSVLHFDYVLCLNVGEYIPKKKEETFLRNLDRLNSRGIILSWDIPNTFNTGTINEKREEEILDLFLNAYNYTYDEKSSALFRKNCSNDALKNCIYIFEKRRG